MSLDAWNHANVEAMLAPVICLDQLHDLGVMRLPRREEPLSPFSKFGMAVERPRLRRGSGSGIEMDETDAHLFTFSDGKVTCWRGFSNRPEALEAVGLRE